MKLIPYVEFDETEREVIAHALRGHALTLVDAGKKPDEVRYPVRAHLYRIGEHREPYSPEAIDELDEVLRRLVVLWEPGSRVEWWRLVGATGSDEAVEGLARERQLALERVARARTVLAAAQDAIGHGEVMCGLGEAART